MTGCNKKVSVDLERVDLSGGMDLMGLPDPMVGYEHFVACDSCLLSVVTSFVASLRIYHFVLRVLVCVFDLISITFVIPA